MRTAKRRDLLIAGAALVVVPATARAQQRARQPRIGFVSPVAPGPRDRAFVQGLADLGYVPGRTVDLEMRFAEGRVDRLPALVAELVRHEVDVLVVGATLGARAAKDATRTIPIVFAASSDPVAGGLVANLARPEGNVTGIATAYGDAFAGKWLELVKEAAPDVVHFAALWSSNNPAAERFVAELRAAAQRLKVRLDAHVATDPGALDGALDAIGGGGARGLVVTPSPLFAGRQDRIVRFAAAARLPAIYFAEDFVEAGGLMSYGPSIVDAYRRAAAYAAKILKGAKPRDLPVEQPTKFELVVNPQVAKTLGLVFPPSILAWARTV